MKTVFFKDFGIQIGAVVAVAGALVAIAMLAGRFMPVSPF